VTTPSPPTPSAASHRRISPTPRRAAAPRSARAWPYGARKSGRQGLPWCRGWHASTWSEKPRN